VINVAFGINVGDDLLSHTVSCAAGVPSSVAGGVEFNRPGEAMAKPERYRWCKQTARSLHSGRQNRARYGRDDSTTLL
jgi:hypothetical protein